MQLSQEDIVNCLKSIRDLARLLDEHRFIMYPELIENKEYFRLYSDHRQWLENIIVLNEFICDDFDFAKAKDELDASIVRCIIAVYIQQPKKIEHGLAEEVYEEIKYSFDVNKTTVWRRIERLRRGKNRG